MPATIVKAASVTVVAARVRRRKLPNKLPPPAGRLHRNISIYLLVARDFFYAYTTLLFSSFPPNLLFIFQVVTLILQKQNDYVNIFLSFSPTFPQNPLPTPKNPKSVKTVFTDPLRRHHISMTVIEIYSIGVSAGRSRGDDRLE
jgi:hypothetical protein